MPSFKRQLAHLAERVSGAIIVHPEELHQLPERVHLRRFFKHFEVDCVFDVGANIGQYAQHLREEVGYEGAIISFEPMPHAVEQLQKRAVGDPNWHIVELALDRESGPASFNVMESDTFSSLHAPLADQPNAFNAQNVIRQQIQVMRSTLALEFPKWREKLGFSRPFLKMDTQGHDLAVFEGAGDTVSAFVGLQSELSLRLLYEGTPGFTESLDAYSKRGFRLSALVPNTAGIFPDLIEMDCIMYQAAFSKPRQVG